MKRGRKEDAPHRKRKTVENGGGEKARMQGGCKGNQLSGAGEVGGRRRGN